MNIFQGRPASGRCRFLSFRGLWAYFVVLIATQKGLTRGAFRSTRRSRCDIIFAVVRDDETVVVVVVAVIIRASRKTACNSKSKNDLAIYAGDDKHQNPPFLFGDFLNLLKV